MSTTTAADHVDRCAPSSSVRLGQYTTLDTTEPREILGVPGAEGSTLVIDQLARTHADARLVAHLAAVEPPENARIVTDMYLADETRGRCRPVTAQDLKLSPLAVSRPNAEQPPSSQASLLDTNGHSYRIREVATGDAFPALRWTRSRHPGCDQDFEVLTLHRENARVSTCQLQCEFDRVTASPIVLNRGLREVVQRKVARGELSMSEIALRCGRVKRDKRGNLSGETSWLARRIGQLPEGGEEEPTRWVHSDVLALIVRQGLGASPHEIEI